MKLKPWYTVVTPREDLREGKPLDASEFAVHLDHVRDGRARPDYQKPQRFFERTFLTENLTSLAAKTTKRLSGNPQASAVYNMSTQFGGGKTHSLTLLYHLFKNGSKAQSFPGVDQILSRAEVPEIPSADVAVFVGTEFDSIHGRGGDDGTPLRNTPWGEIAFQLGGEQGFKVVERHDREHVAPAGDVIRRFLPRDRPALVLMDELMNYVSRTRKSGGAEQLYKFIESLAGVAQGGTGLVLVVSLPASEMEMSGEDSGDFNRFKKLLDRTGEAIIMSASSETSEIIRRRLFEWDLRMVGQQGRVLLPNDALLTCREYADWVDERKNQFSLQPGREAFEATYPFHPMVLSVFERKWQGLPRFQQTRGVLRMLALWVSQAYQQGFKGAQKEPLITLGSAPLENPGFRTAVFEQLGETKLETAVATDIAGRQDSHAIRLDAEAEDTLRKAHIHKRTATSVFFESNGGQLRRSATVPEIRLAVAGPDLETANVQTALEALTTRCYYLTLERNEYFFSLRENLNKRFADRSAMVKQEEIEKAVRDEIQRVFAPAEGIERVFFPEKSSGVPDRPALTLVILGPDQSKESDSRIEARIDEMTRQYGTSGRTYKSALVWVGLSSASKIRSQARALLGWKAIESEGLPLDDVQQRQLKENLKLAARDLTEAIWRAYDRFWILEKDNTLGLYEIGQFTAGSSESPSKYILQQLKQTDKLTKDVSPRVLLKNWPPAFSEWSTKSVRDAFFSSPLLPRILSSEIVKDAIGRGVTDGHFALVGKTADGAYEPFLFNSPLGPADVEISDDVFLISKEQAEQRIKPPVLTSLTIDPPSRVVEPAGKFRFLVKGLDQFGRDFPVPAVRWECPGAQVSDDGLGFAPIDPGSYQVVARAGGLSGVAQLTVRSEEGRESASQGGAEPHITKALSAIRWTGEIPHQKWTQFYLKALTDLVKSSDVKLTLSINVTSKRPNPLSDEQVQKLRTALKEMGLTDDVKTG